MRRPTPPGLSFVTAILALSPAATPPGSAAAQTTTLERQAAADILKEIDALQERLEPTISARAMAAREDAARDRILARVEELWTREGMRALSDHIGRNPEVGWEEHETVDTLTTLLRANGFEVETGAADLETAFVDLDGSERPELDQLRHLSSRSRCGLTMK